MKKKYFVILFSVLIMAGCEKSPSHNKLLSDITSKIMLREKDDNVKQGAVNTQPVLCDSGNGAVVLVFSEMSERQFSKSGIYNAIKLAVPKIHGSAAVFGVSDIDAAYKWLLFRLRKSSGADPAVIVMGYSFGGSSASAFVRKVVSESTRHKVSLLITVDAIKSSTLGFTTSATADIFTFDSKLTGKETSFVAFKDTPVPDSVRLLSHINYYQNNSHLFRGCRIDSASQNYLITRYGKSSVNHGNIDNYVERLLVSDMLKAAGK